MEWWADPRIWAAIVIVAQFVFLILSWIGRKEFATVKQLDSERDRTTANRQEIELMKERLKALPDFHTVNRLREAVSSLASEVKALGVEVKSVDDKIDNQGTVVTRIHQHLLDQAGKQ